MKRETKPFIIIRAKIELRRAKELRKLQPLLEFPAVFQPLDCWAIR